MGKISDTNTRIIITIPKDFKSKLEQLAKENNRSLSNYILNVLQSHIEKSTN